MQTGSLHIILDPVRRYSLWAPPQMRAQYTQVPLFPQSDSPDCKPDISGIYVLYAGVFVDVVFNFQ